MMLVAFDLAHFQTEHTILLTVLKNFGKVSKFRRRVSSIAGSAPDLPLLVMQEQ